ncbi:hypothetical protein LSH36_118g07003 [Paralvinella palmiformis]|uniref:Uncharacterized protein n=1 Tax=Paralvinella palmiformis TaxID=53620 RepID=A0AAD9JZ28_9ANNE|nr:hypothetical protein LSH36_118g07003 [Paralvinella palmiformis]
MARIGGPGAASGDDPYRRGPGFSQLQPAAVTNTHGSISPHLLPGPVFGGALIPALHAHTDQPSPAQRCPIESYKRPTDQHQSTPPVITLHKSSYRVTGRHSVRLIGPEMCPSCMSAYLSVCLPACLSVYSSPYYPFVECIDGPSENSLYDDDGGGGDGDDDDDDGGADGDGDDDDDDCDDGDDRSFSPSV